MEDYQALRVEDITALPLELDEEAHREHQVFEELGHLLKEEM